MSRDHDFTGLEDLSSMKTCDVCSKLNLDVLSAEGPSGKGFLHHPSFELLNSSAAAGCEMCSMFLGGVKTADEDRAYRRHDEELLPWSADPTLLSEVPCLITPKWKLGKIREIKYSIPDGFQKGSVKNWNGQFISAHFLLRNYPGKP